MRVLIVNVFYPPTVDAHAYRWGQLSRLWASRGHEVEVISGKVKGFQTIAVENGVSIVRVGLVSRSPFALSQTAFAFTRHIIAWLRKFYRTFYWPDGWWHWFPFVFKQLLERRRHDYDLIVSYLPCFSAHLAVLVMRRLGSWKTARWIADYGDPFSVSDTMQPNNFVLYRTLNCTVEKIILESVDGVAFNNVGTYQSYVDRFGPLPNVAVIPHLVDLAVLYSRQRHEGSGDMVVTEIKDKVDIVYIGGFHKGIREPNVLIELFKRLKSSRQVNFVLSIFGPTNGVQLESLCDDAILYKGVVPRSQAISIMKQADLLVNVENNNCVMTPSKVAEYIATGRPIINICGNGQRSKGLSEYSMHGFVLDVSGAIAEDELEELAKFIRNAPKRHASLDVVKSVLGENTINRVSDVYMRLGGGEWSADGN